jgi:hypothetical protein
MATTKIGFMGKHKLPPGVSAEAIARIAKVSVQLAYKKLSRGKTASEIIVEAARWHEMQEASKIEIPIIPYDGTNGTDSHTINGHGNLSYAAAQAAKERALAELRQIEVLQKKGELTPTSYFKHWASNFLIQGREILQWGPKEMRDELAAESDPFQCEAIVSRWLERVMERFYQLETLWNPPLDKDGGCAPISPGS